jgi:hypothetical protein
MAKGEIFDWACAHLEEMTSLSDLEARGTVRLALKQTGLDARSVTSQQMGVLLERVLPEELRVRDIENASEVCGTLAQRLKEQSFADAESADAPEAVFRRLGGGH